MSSTLARTSWDDLSNLGLAKQRVFDALNANRGYTMRTLNDLALNETFAEDFGWYSYNDFKGTAHPLAPDVSTKSTQEVVWEFKNSGQTSFTDTWTEGWENTERVDAFVSTEAKINITGKIEVQGFFDTGFIFYFGAKDSHPQFKQDKHTFNQTWKIVVPPGKHYRLARIRTVKSGTQEFRVDYGVTNDSSIGTVGYPWRGAYYWVFTIDYWLRNPTGTMFITGNLTETSYTFKLEEVQDNGKAIEVPGPIDIPSSAKFSRTGTELNDEEITKSFLRSNPKVPEDMDKPVEGQA